MATSPLQRALPVASVILLGIVTAGLLTLLFFHLRPSASADTKAYPQVTQPPPKVAVPTVAFIGDSYSAGTGSTGFNARFTTLVSAYEGWEQENFAYGGTGYLREAVESKASGCESKTCPNYSEVIEQVKAADPNIVVVSGGRNDVGLTEGDVDRAVVDFYTRLREAVPSASIVVTSPMWAYDSPPAQLEQITTVVRDEAARVGATYLDLGEPLVKTRSLVSADRVHPNNAGHAEIARLIEVALSAASSTPTPTPTPSDAD